MTHRQIAIYFDRETGCRCQAPLEHLPNYFNHDGKGRLILAEVWVCPTCDRVLEVSGPMILIPGQGMTEVLRLSSYPYSPNRRQCRRRSP